MTHEQNLLFAAFAVQMSLVTAPEALEITAAWARDPETSLPDRLVDAQALTKAGRATILQLVQAAENEFKGDTAGALDAAIKDPHAFGRYYHRIALSEHHTPEEASTIAGISDSQSSQDPPRIIHETPGRYEGESEYARGGMGRVLLVHDAHLGRDIAMKELLPNVSHSGETVSLAAASPVRLSVPLINRFLQEARITGQLEHPSIVPVYELGNRRNGQLYYTMKLVRGETLHRAIQNASDPSERLTLLPHFVDLCQAIAYAHSRGVLHRDIKPANVMVGEFGETVVLDWGLAKGRDQRDVHQEGFSDAMNALNTGGDAALADTEYGQIVGTPAYMPPEQARGELDCVDERSDVYALGAVLYEILTGHTPHTGNTKMEILKRVLEGHPEPVHLLAPKAPPEIVAICEKALQTDPKRRYQSAKELAEEVQRFLSGAVVRAYEYTPYQIIHRYYHRHRALVHLALAALTLLASGLVYYNIRLYQSRQAERVQRMAAEESNARLTKEVYASTIVAAQRFVNEQNTERALDYLARCPDKERGWEWGHLRRACSPFLADAPHDPLKVGTVMALRCRFSDDDRYVLSKWSSGGTLTVYDRSESAYVYYSPVDIFLGFPQTTDFGPDPGHLTAGIDYTTVAYFNWQTGETIRTFAIDEGWLWSFSVSPDARYAAGGVYNEDTSERALVLWDFQTGEELQRHPLLPREHPGYEGIPVQYKHYHIAGTYPFGRVGGFIQESSKVVFSDDDLCILDIESGEITRKMPCRGGAFDLDEQRGWVLYIRPEGTVGQWDLNSDSPLPDLGGATDAIEAVYGGRANPYAGLREHRGRWSLWNASTGTLIDRVQSASLDLQSIDIADGEPVATTLASGSHLKFWQVRETRVEEVFPFTDPDGAPLPHEIYNPYAWPYHSYAIHPARDRIAILTRSNALRLFRIPEMTLIREWQPHDDKVMEIGFSHDGTFLTSTSWDGWAKVWDTESGAELHAFAPEFEEACYTAAITPDNQTLALGYGERSSTDRAETPTLFYDMTTGALQARVDLEGHRIQKLAYSPDGRLLFTGVWGLNGSEDHSFEIYRTSDFTAPAARINGLGWGDKVAFYPNGRYALLHGGSLEPVYFDMQTLTVRYIIPKSQAMTIDFHPSGDRFVTAVHTLHQANIHRASDGRIMATLDNILGPAFFSADGESLYTLTGDGQARLFRSQAWE